MAKDVQMDNQLENELPVHKAYYQSKIGDLEIKATDRGILSVQFVDRKAP